MLKLIIFCWGGWSGAERASLLATVSRTAFMLILGVCSILNFLWADIFDDGICSALLRSVKNRVSETVSCLE